MIKFSFVTHTLIRPEESTNLKLLRQRERTISRPSSDQLDILERDLLVCTDVKMDNIKERKYIPSFIECIDGKYRSHPVARMVEICEQLGSFFFLTIVDEGIFWCKILTNIGNKLLDRDTPI